MRPGTSFALGTGPRRFSSASWKHLGCLTIPAPTASPHSGQVRLGLLVIGACLGDNQLDSVRTHRKITIDASPPVIRPDDVRVIIIDEDARIP